MAWDYPSLVVNGNSWDKTGNPSYASWLDHSHTFAQQTGMEPNLSWGANVTAVCDMNHTVAPQYGDPFYVGTFVDGDGGTAIDPQYGPVTCFIDGSDAPACPNPTPLAYLNSPRYFLRQDVFSSWFTQYIHGAFEFTRWNGIYPSCSLGPDRVHYLCNYPSGSLKPWCNPEDMPSFLNVDHVIGTDAPNNNPAKPWQYMQFISFAFRSSPQACWTVPWPAVSQELDTPDTLPTRYCTPATIGPRCN